MIALIQRAGKSNVTAFGETVGEIENGLVVFLGVFSTDCDAECEFLAKKTADLRIFSDENDKMNLSVKDVNGGILVISNFTLCADAKKGNRPSYENAMNPVEAERLYEKFCELLCKNGVGKVEKGCFGAHMIVNVENNGPISVILDTDKIMRKAEKK